MYFKAFYDNFKDEFVYLWKENDKLPDTLTCEKPNTMENDTITRRIPETILRRVEEQTAEYIKKHNIDVKLERLRELFKNADKNTYDLLKCNLDEKYWNFLLSYHIDRDIKIINNIWLFNEYYFYRYLSYAYDYENSNYDFFEREKYDSINCNKSIIEDICICANKLIEINNKKPDKKIFSIFFYLALWSNQYDLSWNPTKDKNKQHDTDEKDIKKKILREKKFYFETENIDKLHDSFFLEKIICNDINSIYKDITTQKRKRFDIVLDNMGVELITDLCLLYFLTSYFDEITIHVKKFPLFVSDTMNKDIHYSLSVLCSDNKVTKNEKDIYPCYPNTVLMANKWKQLIDSKRWKIRDDIYWNIPLPYWIMPKSLHEELKKSYFVCFKGDANYRRCLGDLKFNFSKPHKDVLSYFPFRVIALRCLKSPLGCGIDKTVVQELTKSSDDWSNYGEYAILQYFSPE